MESSEDGRAPANLPFIYFCSVSVTTVFLGDDVDRMVYIPTLLPSFTIFSNLVALYGSVNITSANSSIMITIEGLVVLLFTLLSISSKHHENI